MFTSDELKLWRLRLGLTQEQAAHALDISRVHYSEMERGVDRALPLKKSYALACAAIEEEVKPLGKWGQ